MHVLHLGEGRWGCVGVPRMLRPDLSALSVGAVGAGAGAGWSAPPGRLRLADSDSCPHCDEVHAPDAACIGQFLGGRTNAKVRSEKTLDSLIKKQEDATKKAEKLVGEQKQAVHSFLTRQTAALWGPYDNESKAYTDDFEPKWTELAEHAKNMAKLVDKMRTSFRDLQQKENQLQKLKDELKDAQEKQAAKDYANEALGKGSSKKSKAPKPEQDIEKGATANLSEMHQKTAAVAPEAAPPP